MHELVSVIVPVYNVEKYLDRCVESIVNQTYKNLEIILVDDQSPDHCPEICDEWAKKDSRIKVVHKENAGLGPARNTGMDNASGKYICFFDSDDYVDTSLVEKCVENADKNNSDVVVFGRCDVYEDGRITPRPITAKKFLFEGEEIKNNFLPDMLSYGMGFGVSAWSKLYSLNTLKQHKLKFMSEREIISEDAYFALELFSKISTVSIVPENFYFYYKRENSLSRVYNKERQIKNDVFLQKCLQFCENAGYPEKISSHIKSRYHTLSLATMKQLMGAELPRKEKHRALKEIFNNNTLIDTITPDVICMDYPLSRFFWKLFKKRHYQLCCLLLWYKAHR